MCGEQWLEKSNPFVNETQIRVKSALLNIISAIHKTDNSILSAETHLCTAITDLLPLLNDFSLNEDDAHIVLFAIGQYLAYQKGKK